MAYHSVDFFKFIYFLLSYTVFNLLLMCSCSSERHTERSILVRNLQSFSWNFVLLPLHCWPQLDNILSNVTQFVDDATSSFRRSCNANLFLSMPPLLINKARQPEFIFGIHYLPLELTRRKKKIKSSKFLPSLLICRKGPSVAEIRRNKRTFCGVREDITAVAEDYTPTVTCTCSNDVI